MGARKAESLTTSEMWIERELSEPDKRRLLGTQLAVNRVYGSAGPGQGLLSKGPVREESDYVILRSPNTLPDE